MNIVYIYRSLTAFGGVERIFTDKANYLAEKKGYKVYFITFEQGEHPIVYPLSPKVTHIDLNVCFYKQYKYGKLKRILMQSAMEKEFYTKLTEQVTRIQADVIICASCEFTVMRLVTRLKGTVKKIIESHEAKAYVEKETQYKGNAILRIFFKLKDKMLYRYIRRADAFVTLTRDDANDWKPVKNAYVIPNILTLYPAEIGTVKKKGKRVISAGRLTEQKGYDLLLVVWQIVNRRHSDWKLDIYGKGKDETILSEKIKELRLEESVFLHAPTTAIYDKYKESDFYVMSSRWEGFGLVLAEAMSCSIPCISFDCPHGPSDVITDGEDGLLAENGNIEQLAQKICYLIEHEDIRLEMGCKARENVKRYLPENVMPQWISLFESLTNKYKKV